MMVDEDAERVAEKLQVEYSIMCTIDDILLEEFGHDVSEDQFENLMTKILESMDGI